MVTTAQKPSKQPKSFARKLALFIALNLRFKERMIICQEDGRDAKQFFKPTLFTLQLNPVTPLLLLLRIRSSFKGTSA